MTRPRSFDEDQVVEEAKDVFWANGYQGTAIDDLERRTGLNRSSLYGSFGNKEAIFTRALDAYVHSFIDELLQPMERREAGSDDIQGFFDGLAERFRTDETAARGCLMVNSIAELEGSTGTLQGRGATFRTRLRAAFANALAHEADPAVVDERARLLTATTLGVWLTVRVDPSEAARMCDAVAAQLRA